MADGDLEIITTETDLPHPLGRNLFHNPDNRLHRALAVVPKTLVPRTKHWYSPDTYDQQGSSCTAQSAIGLCRSTPNYTPFRPHWPLFDTEAERHALYIAAQFVDPWPGGEPQYEGSSSDAPLIVLRERGHISGWKWLFGFDEVKQWIMYYGPCGVGTIWYQSMFNVDANGYIIVDRGAVAGGHAWRIVGYSVTRDAFRLVNSWGRGWGDNGRAWIKAADLRHLLEAQGEAVVVVGAA